MLCSDDDPRDIPMSQQITKVRLGRRKGGGRASYTPFSLFLTRGVNWDGALDQSCVCVCVCVSDCN